MAKDYYKILGADKNTSQDELKKLFRKASLKWHPDRWSDKDEKAKKEAEDKFKEISEAYEVLSDPDKRARYDQFGENWDQVNQGGFGGFDDINDIMKHMSGGMFGDFFGHHGQQNRGPVQGKTIQMQYSIDIHEIFNGLNKDIEVDAEVRCEKCHGTGGDSETCSHCHGTGMITHTQRTAFGIMTQQSACPYCHGTGKIIKNKCSECNGTGMKHKKRKIRLNIKPYTANGYVMQFTGMGYESKDPHGMNGDLLIQIIYNIDSNRFVIQGNTIYEKIKIPYYDAILGCERKIVYPNFKEDTINIKPLSQEGDQVIKSGKGLNGSNYIFIISIELPQRSISEKLSDKEKELLEKIKKLHK